MNAAGISNAEDPGWFADWDFVENGQDICHPDSAVLRTEYGVIHDDVNCLPLSFAPAVYHTHTQRERERCLSRALTH
jgi:hypothetical protein